MIAICFSVFFTSTVAVAVPKNVKVGRGLMVEASPEEINFNIVISMEGEKINFDKPAIIELKIENISKIEQKIDFWNIIARVKREKEALPPSFFFKNNLNCKIVLPKGTFASIKIPLSNIYKIDKLGEYVFQVQYELPNSNKAINSNELKVIMEP